MTFALCFPPVRISTSVLVRGHEQLMRIDQKVKPEWLRRKAYRLGKWLADLNAIRKTPLTTRFSYLEILASGGEGVYYFVEQLTW